MKLLSILPLTFALPYKDTEMCRNVPSGTTYRDPNDCSIFYVCDAGGNPVQKQCAPGTAYDIEHNMCDYTENVDCENTPVPEPVEPTPAPDTTVAPQTGSTQAPEPVTTNCPTQFQYNVIYIDWKVNWNDVRTDIKASIDNCFNVINIAFALSYGQADALQVWTQLSNAEKQEILDYAHARGAKLVMSVGGATEGVEQNLNSADNYQAGFDYGVRYGNMAVELMFDGVDFDLELQPKNYKPFLDGSAQDFFRGNFDGARSVNAGFLITAAPQGPYLGAWTREDTYGFTELLKDPNTNCDFVNIQYYNQGTAFYNSYDNLFIAGIDLPEADGEIMYTSESAVLELINNGVPAEKIVVGKPLTTANANNGWVAHTDLNQWACRLLSEHGHAVGGFMIWMYQGATDPAFLAWGPGVGAAC